MADNKPLTFVISDESVNSHGTRILTAGIDLATFKRNPIMLWMHNRAWRGTTDEVLPIGRWENVRKEGEKLLADAVFDEKDTFAQAIKSKVEQGIISMASIGIDIIATSDDKAVIVQGQRYPTIIKSRLKECSLCDIGSNSNALKLYDEFGEELKLSEGGYGHLLPKLELINQNPTEMNLREQIANTLGLKETQCDETLLLSHVQAVVKENAELTAQVVTFRQADKDRTEAKITSLVDTAITERRITASDRECYLNLARASFTDTSAILAKMPVAVDLSADGINTTTGGQSAWDKRMSEINGSKQ